MQRDAQGKPALLGSGSDPLERTCSISHTRDWLACAFADQALVGIDIEVATTRDYVETGTWFYGAELGERLATATPQQQRFIFYRAWTAYEALYKCGINRRRTLAPLIGNSASVVRDNIALHWLVGPDELHACMAIVNGARIPQQTVEVLCESADSFSPDSRWRPAQLIA